MLILDEPTTGLDPQARRNFWDLVKRIRAEGTTLGADNGLGISYMLALLDSKDIPHPPLECVMTVMEEMGKVGGDNVDLTKLSGKRMMPTGSQPQRIALPY